ncbi:Cytochrome P450 monooxygenase [Fulvia fulva]|uniref:Cytochrome P450 monooxygenase n=1 Tax=Passalora fulva TaxID=5499 RepID=A0A9Q8UT86_PASFU|nr:Cytochrome P450 monooxygenase [Fulvia fulva]KAK4613926.1 Cytochrome P450 monooxygenase [Fulvia fulva]KAK4614294.1 Cytochrome P450 monooxygenase [Fulvia fulva]UJO21520.1 Cytochrome P450 monooxygenase [Fulvia fulva]WPV20069.1 Cytochrome P450 monooxygenase [Fulvia fulva]WPV35075.1 Cytochrome P450 monooxygenase [Fulvia fulva]
MLSFIVLALAGLLVLYLGNTYRCFRINLALAKRSGLPYIAMPIYTFNRFWLVTHALWLPWIQRLPKSWTQDWIDFLQPDFVWTQKHRLFKEIGSDVLLLVAPGSNTLYVADAEAVTQITARRNDFPKPTWMYSSVDIFGKSVVSTEGALWRHHRKITSPPFTEKNNYLVWTESLQQAESMMAGWISKDANDSGALWNVATESMRLSLHVISRAGFGVHLHWPHEDKDTPIPEGHTMTYKDALESLLHNMIVMILTPTWLLSRSPLKFHKTAHRAFSEWGQYMREMYQEKRNEVKSGQSREGMDLMGALVKGAGMTEESLNEKATTDPEKGGAGKGLLSDEEIFGNAFVFILAGHETAANTIHFSILYLAMKMTSQRRLQEDLDAILGDRPVSEWDYEKDMPKLFGSMCGAVMNEELRLIPPVVGIPKTTPNDRPQGLQVNGKHVTVPENCYVTLDTVATHRNPKYWPHTSEEDLLEFRPERWLLDPSKTNANTEDSTYAEEEGLDFDGPDKRPDTAASLFRPAKGAYVPFSEGYRSCLGRRFAQVEILAVLAVIFKTHTVELDVSEYLSDEEFKTATEAQKLEAWKKADARARELLENGMMTIITIQMRKGKVPFRFVKRGCERFKF